MVTEGSALLFASTQLLECTTESSTCKIFEEVQSMNPETQANKDPTMEPTADEHIDSFEELMVADKKA